MVIRVRSLFCNREGDFRQPYQPEYFIRDNALEFILQGRIAANTGASSIFDAHHDKTMSASQKASGAP